MDEDRHQLLARVEIIRGLVKAMSAPEALLRVCASVHGGADEAQTAVATAFDVDKHVAMAILDLQVRRFTPHAFSRIRAELDDLEARLAR